MTEFLESALEFANFTFESNKVICYGLKNKAGGTTTILNFPSEGVADAFDRAFLRGRNFDIIVRAVSVPLIAAVPVG